jgi:hypothetical protein
MVLVFSQQVSSTRKKGLRKRLPAETTLASPKPNTQDYRFHALLTSIQSHNPQIPSVVQATNGKHNSKTKKQKVNEATVSARDHTPLYASDQGDQ